MLPKGYRELLVPCGKKDCGATVPFVVWDGSENLPMVKRCPVCGHIMSQEYARKNERKVPS
jgi:hypothetical protein